MEASSTYSSPFDDPKRNLSLLAEVGYRMPERVAKGWGAKLGVGYDHGALLGNNFGLQLTITKSGAIHF